MTAAQLLDLKGKKLGEVTLDNSVFGDTPNEHVLHGALLRQLANARAGTASTKTRSEVRGGGRKPWRQKGTGRARAGSIRSPLWEGGGVIFGPKPRHYTLSMPKKVRQLALRSALAARAGNLVIVKDFAELREAKTKAMAGILKALQLSGKKVLLILDYSQPGCELVERAARNIKEVKVLALANLNVKDLMACDCLLTTEKTLQEINLRFSGGGSAASEAEKASGESLEAGADMAEPAQAKGKKKAASGKEPEAHRTEAKPKETRRKRSKETDA